MLGKLGQHKDVERTLSCSYPWLISL